MKRVNIIIIISILEYPGDVNDVWEHLNNKYDLGVKTTFANPKYKPRVRVVSVPENILDDLSKEQYVKFVYDAEIFIDLC